MLGRRHRLDEAQSFVKRVHSAIALAALVGCGGVAADSKAPPKTDEQYRTEAVVAMRDALRIDIDALVKAATTLQAAAPLPDDRGWDPALDAQAIVTMRQAWFRARSAWEHIEGAVAPLFPELATSLDSRYEELLAPLAPGGDAYLFDEQGVTGMDAVERVLYADVIPARIVTYETTLPGYQPARYPATEAEARDFRNRLCGKLVQDATLLAQEWSQKDLDVQLAFGGLVSLVAEQGEEIERAAQGAEESRYSQKSMEALRDNLEGTEAISGLYREWLLSKVGGADIDEKITSGMRHLEDQYAGVAGQSLPEAPTSWNTAAPSPQDLATPFGQLYQAVSGEVDPARAGTLTWHMLDEARILGIAAKK
jgi:iron uptake system component EfeO